MSAAINQIRESVKAQTTDPDPNLSRTNTTLFSSREVLAAYERKFGSRAAEFGFIESCWFFPDGSPLVANPAREVAS